MCVSYRCDMLRIFWMRELLIILVLGKSWQQWVNLLRIDTCSRRMGRSCMGLIAKGWNHAGSYNFLRVVFFNFELCPDFIGATCNREWAEMSRGFLRPENALLVCLDSCQLRCRWSSFGSAALKQEKLECLTSIRPQASWSVVMFSQSSGAKRSCRCP